MDKTSMPFGALASTEAIRQAILRQYDILDTPPEEAFDRITRLAAHLFQVPFAALSLSDTDRQWFKSCVGIELNEIEGAIPFCEDVMAAGDVVVVPDARENERYADNPLVVGDPHLRFHAGVPVLVEGYAIGTLCVMDREPQTPSKEALNQLREMAAIIADRLELRRRTREQERIQHLQTHQQHILEQIATETPLPNVLADIVVLAEKHSPDARGSVLMYDSDAHVLRHSAAPNLPVSYTAEIDGIIVGPTVGSCGAAVHHNAQVVTEDIATDPRWDNYKELALSHDLRACWSTPIRDKENNVLGTFALYFSDRRVPSPADQQFIDAVVQLARVAITYHRQRTALETERKRLEMTLYGGDLGSWACNFNTREYTFDNRWARMLGYAPENTEPTLDFFLHLVHPEDRPLFHDALHDHFNGNRDVIEATLRMRTQEGNWRFILTRGKVIGWNDDSTPQRAIGTHMDLTETRNAKKALQEQKEILQMIFDHVPAMISFYTMDGTLSMVNRHWEQVVGWSMEDALRHPDILQSLFPDDALRARAWAFLREAPDAWEDYPVRTRKGSVIDTSWTIVAPTPDLRIAIGIDISERKRYEKQLIEAKEEAEEMSRLKSSFLANMSHEIRTPLTAIIGFSEVLSNENLKPPANRFVQLVQQAGERLMQTLNSVLSLSQLEAGAMELTPEPFDLARHLANAHTLFQSQAESENIAFTTSGLGHTTPVVLDENAVHRIVSNLLSNALKFTNDGGTVHLGLVSTATHVEITVEDTGIGINEAFVERLFDPFRQESTGHQRTHEGSGLGLAITHELVELMEGTIDVATKKEEGTRFTVRLPREMCAFPVQQTTAMDAEE